MIDKVSAAMEAKLQESLQAANRTSLLRQSIIIQHVPSLLFGLLIDGATSEHTLALQDMAQEVFIKLVDIAIDSKTQTASEFAQKKQETLSGNQRLAIASLTKLFSSYFVNRDLLTGNHTSLVLSVKEALETTV